EVWSAPEPVGMPACTFCWVPPTRTMKNSSRFELKMARNLSRSSIGTVGSWASSSTRRLNSSQLRSRLTYRAGSSRLTGDGGCIGASPYDWTPPVYQSASRRASGRPPNGTRSGGTESGDGARPGRVARERGVADPNGTAYVGADVTDCTNEFGCVSAAPVPADFMRGRRRSLHHGSSMGIKFRLLVMNFLEFFVWGAWLISLGAYTANTLHFSAVQTA